MSVNAARAGLYARLTVCVSVGAAGLLWPTGSPAQPLALDDAIAIAQRANPDVRAASAAADDARGQRDAARSAWFPRVVFQEGWQRGDQPVFAFGSLLGQRRFTEADFAVASLNQPDAISNYRAAVGVRQPLFDLAATAARTRQATASMAMAQAGVRVASADIAMAVARAYGRALTADTELHAAEGAVMTATSARARASARRDAGTVTQADLMSFEVQLAQMQARRVRAASDAAVARATVNRLLGRALDTPFDLVDPAPADDLPSVEASRQAGLRPELAAAAQQVAVADANLRAARAAWLPTVSMEAGWEWNGNTWTSRASAWVVGVQAQWSISSGGAERALVRSADAVRRRAAAQQASADAAAHLDLLSASADVESARARSRIGAAAVAQAREGERIIRDRYDAGLATATDVLVAAQALLDAQSLAGSSRADLAVALVALRRAQGTLDTPRGPDRAPSSETAGRPDTPAPARVTP